MAGLVLILAPIFVTPLGVYLAGNAAGANGSYWGALGGAFAGGLLSLVPVGLLLRQDHYVLALASVAVLGVAGAMGGYEIWNHGKDSPANPSPLVATNARIGPLPFSVLWRF